MNELPQGAITMAALLIALYLFLRLFMDVEAGKRRRWLQNLVFRGYRVLEWLNAVCAAVDAGLLTYYRRREELRISPISERRFKPTPAPAQAAKSEAAQEALEHP